MTGLYCFPHSGGLSHQLRPLAREIAPDRFHPVDYPQAVEGGGPPASVGEFVDGWLRSREDAGCADAGFEDACLYGHSLGGLVAFETAVRLERRGTPAAALVMGACVPGGAVRPAARISPQTCTDDELLDWSFDVVRGRRPSPADREVFAAFAPRLRRDLRVYEGHRVDGRLEKTPVLLLLGTEDPVCPLDARRHWTPHVTRLTCVEIKGGHMFHQDDPAATAAAIRDWRAG
ncbi:thioesterase II family protein [Streptomyces zhihengii]|uniref:thioesterase II family protein n=1 Tax=Streptomyces zhihengii TaxID=1818004 RepID=UPI0034570DD2